MRRLLVVTGIFIDGRPHPQELDPGAFSRPFTVRYESALRPAGDDLMEYICAENNQYGFASGVR